MISRFRKHCLAGVRLLGALCLSAMLAQAADWRIGDDVYHNVKVREVTPRAVIIQHQKGITQILLADLPPEAQKRFGYDPVAAQAEKQRIEREHAAAMERSEDIRESLTEDHYARRNPNNVESLKQAFRRPARLSDEVDLRPHMRELGLFSKSQGRRPSCSVFAVVGALEYQSALAGKPTQYSEEYAIWATRQYLANMKGGTYSAFGEGDAGFALPQVFNALGQYGIVRRDDMPNTFGTGMDSISAPTTGLVERARGTLNLRVLRVDASEPEVTINRLTHCLNRGLPVVIGAAWPHENSLRAAPMVSGQTPAFMHAVTLVGYRTDPGGENQRFVFKNSWGPQWGSGGYGWITAAYLREHLIAAYVLDPTFDGR